MRPWLSRATTLVAAACGALLGSSPAADRTEFPDLSGKSRLVILAFGDSGTGETAQYQVGQAMFEVCRQRACDLALMMGDNFYENGIEIRERYDARRSFEEIIEQFDDKFESPYGAFRQMKDFRFWAVLGNHDYRRHSADAQVTYSRFSKLWRMPAFHYELPGLPDWLQIYGFMTDSEQRRDLNGLQVAAAKLDLCAEGGRPDRWKFAFGHHPIRNFGRHGGDSNEERTRALLAPLFLECGVHLYLAGHGHHQAHLSLDGLEQIIQGAAGKRTGSNGCRGTAGVEQRFYRKEYGFAVIEVDPGKLIVDYYGVPNADKQGVEPRAEPIYHWAAEKKDIGKPAPDGGCYRD